MMKRLVILAWLLAAFINNDLYSQSREGNRNNFYEAESWILFEAYQDALPLYLQLIKEYPTNANFKYRIGQCYMNMPGEKIKAISYLEDAAKNIDPKYREGKFNEQGAPYDALYYLANAYRINNQIEKALKTYEVFRKNLNSEVYDTTVVNLQIQSCKNAKDLMKMPLFIKEKNLGGAINSQNNEFNPVISDKEDMMVFSRSLAFYDAIMYSVKKNGVWSEPVNLNEVFKVDRDLFPTSISKDDKDLYLYSSADYDGIIYVSHFDNGSWSPIVKLNDNINTKYWESHATISHDNRRLYFTSNRKGTYGGLDIYVSSRDSTGDWGPAVNLGPVINTPYNEESPFLSADDKTLFFSSRGHFNMGGYDIFYSSLLDNGEWSVPLNVGYPLNTTDDDVFFKPLNQGYEGYTAKELPGNSGKQDIYRIEIYSDKHPRKFFVRGMVKVADLINNINDSVKISAMNIKNPDQTIIVYSNPKTGEYEFQLPQGDYQITYEGEGSGKVVQKLNLPLLSPADSFIIPGTTLPKTDFEAELRVKSNRNISVTKGDTIIFPMKVEPNSVLTVEHYVGDSLVTVEHFVMRDTIFNYKMVPSKGKNRIVFKLADKFNNVTKTEVYITREKNIQEQPVIAPQYDKIISAKQIEAYSEMLKKPADKKMADVIAGVNTEKTEFSSVDEYITLLKKEAEKKGLDPDELDKLALQVAVTNNILTQAAVDYLARHSEGELKEILSNLNIAEANLKTWTDLQEYINEKTGGKIDPVSLNKLAAAALGTSDLAIGILRNKILVYSESDPNGEQIKKIVEATDKSKPQNVQQWLETFYNEAIKQGLTPEKISQIFAAISAAPETGLASYINELIQVADPQLAALLKTIDLAKEGINTPEDLLKYLLANKDKFNSESVSGAIARLIISNDVPVETIISSAEKAGGHGLKWILLSIGAVLIVILVFLFKKRRNKKE